LVRESTGWAKLNDKGCWEEGAHISGSLKVMSRRRYADMFRAVCDGAPSCCRVH